MTNRKVTKHGFPKNFDIVHNFQRLVGRAGLNRIEPRLGRSFEQTPDVNDLLVIGVVSSLHQSKNTLDSHFEALKGIRFLVPRRLIRMDSGFGDKVLGTKDRGRNDRSRQQKNSPNCATNEDLGMTTASISFMRLVIWALVSARTWFCSLICDIGRWLNCEVHLSAL